MYYRLDDPSKIKRSFTLSNLVFRKQLRKMNLILEFLLTYPNFLIIDQLKIKFCRITSDKLEWFGSSLSNRNQPSQINIAENTEFKSVKCGVPQVSILGPLLLLLCVNDSEYSSDLLEPRISADDRNFFPNDKIDMSLSTINKELENITGSCDCIGTRTHKQLVRKRTLNHLAKLV